MMKKVLAILVIAMFLGGITAPVFASDNSALSTISLADDDPKKVKKTKKSVKKSEKKSSDCNAEAKKDCGKSCGGSSK